MARRIAINFGHRTATNNRSLERGRGRGRGRGVTKTVVNNQQLEAKSVNASNSELKIETNSTMTYNSKVRNSEKESIMLDKPLKKIESNTTEFTPKVKKEISVDQIKSPIRDENQQLEITIEPTDLKKLMGFENFDSTKNKHVKGTDCYGINFKQKTEYRQYMNREGGFNRSLSPTRGDRKRIKLSLKK